MGLRERLNDLATQFADGVLTVLREIPLSELTGGERKEAKVTADRPAKREGRLPRRSAAEVDQAIEKVVALLGGDEGGARAEEIREECGFDVREMPRILKQGVATKKLKILGGQKRATLYGLASQTHVRKTATKKARRPAKKK